MARDPRKRQIGAYVPQEIKEALQREAEANQRNLSNQLQVIVTEWLEKQKRDANKKPSKG